MNRTVLVTCCAADKDPAPGEMAAIHRYRSTRIDAVAELAARRDWGFGILSGKFGLLAAGTPIPDYDHLLLPAEVVDLARRVADQLAERAPERVVFYTRSPGDDPDSVPYRKCCEKACALAGVPCVIVETPDGPLTAGNLEVP